VHCSETQHARNVRLPVMFVQIKSNQLCMARISVMAGALFIFVQAFD